jgi:hypothetical protein
VRRSRYPGVVVLYGLAESVLKVTYELLKNAGPVTPDAVCEAVRRPPGDRETKAVLGRLYAEGYIGAEGDVVTADSAPAPAVIIATEKGLGRRRQRGSARRQMGVD